MQFASVLSRELDASVAGEALSRAARRELGERPADLACVFFSSHYAAQADELSFAIRRVLSSRVLIGCSGEGVIGASEEIEHTPAVTLWAALLPGALLAPVRLHGHQHGEDVDAVVSSWPNNLEPSAPPVLLLLADPFSTPMDEVLSSIEERTPGAAAIGGLAGGGRTPGDNRLLLNEDVYDNGLVGVALSGPLSIRMVVSQGCRPIGERFVITKAHHNVISELGGAPAIERIQALFESLTPEDRHLAQQSLHIGIVIDEQRDRFERGDFLVRNLIGADRGSGSIAIGDVVKEGQSVQFHIRDAQSASEDLHLMLAGSRARQKNPPLSALMFSCCGRGRGLFGRPHHDVTVLRERAGSVPIAGFFAQGEIGPIGGCNFVHGYTASVALFSEPADTDTGSSPV